VDNYTLKLDTFSNKKRGELSRYFRICFLFLGGKGVIFNFT
jgi:hypothetical protein